MRKRFFVRMLAGATLLGSVSACGDDPLSVENTNNPDVGRVLGELGAVETVVSKLFQQMHQGMYTTSASMWAPSMVMAFESASGLGNFEMGAFSTIPRSLIDNALGNKTESENFQWYDGLGRNARGAANAVGRLNDFAALGASLCPPPTSAANCARDARAKSFGYFVLGYAHGHLALMYDSAAVTPPGLASDEIPPLSPASEVAAAAIRFLDSALVISQSAQASGTAGWPIPNAGATAWIISPAEAITLARYQQIVRSFRARFRAGVARNPGERGAVDWAAVIADATSGIQSDLVLALSLGLGWTNAWISQALQEATWHQMPPFIIGMADTAVVGGVRPYEAWLSTPLATRDGAAFLIRTPDLRFPSGDTRPAQQAVGTGIVPANPILYFRNRATGGDAAAHKEWRFSFYDHIRFGAYRQNASNGPWVTISRAEVDMLAAEGYIRTAQSALAIPLIDRYRTQAGMPSAGTLALGLSNCVPRVPQPPGFTTTACGSLMEAMKWEKRMETAFTGAAQWYVDSRGWGDLVVGTVTEWPTPYQDLLARALPIYSVTAASRAAAGTYGF